MVTIIGPEQIGRSSGKTVAELLSEQAGIIVNGAGSNPGKDKSLFFRGAGSQYTVILLDGIVANDPSGSGGVFDLRLIPIDQIERIEILKGGQSTLYGSDAVAGVINIVTKKEGKPGNNVFGSATAGNYDTYRGTIGLSSTADRITYNLNLSHSRTGGISEAALPPAGSTVPFDKDGFRQTAFNGNFSIRLDDSGKVRVSPFIRYFTEKGGFDDGSFADAKNEFLGKSFHIGGNAIYALKNGRFNFNYSHQNNEREYQTAFPATYNGLTNLLDFYYTQSIGEHVQILGGIDNRYTFIKIKDTQLPDNSANQFAAYASVVLNKLSIFNLELGGRYNKHNRYGENYTYTVNPFLTFLNDDLKVFGTVSTSFKAPDLIALFGPFGANADLKPERSNSYEAGFQSYFIDKKLSFRAVGYQRKINDAIVYVGRGYLNQ
ncbi:MAG: TonB-dependent receptor, partial [Mucilaginibacter polytrichastri]|nr:TonB-dependent receptor [Mucilaginibacter polytrichastri]